ncbi:MAG: DNA-directed RNA polymerase subunit omega [Opitutae bacterium]|jgi:DNA-directed RNA polymerase subunit omega|nr:DNA-directed RNA polymerase subunit omega [Opitutae bacterium]NBY42255.1 DNA-directed RNA polymerase subunit omega [Verrucomicrobiota bacterium]
MRDDYLLEAKKKITDPNILINVVSRRVKQLRATAERQQGAPAKYKHLLGGDLYETLSPEDIALREIIEGKITWNFAAEDQVQS